MATVEIFGDRIAIHSEYRERDLCKQVPGSRWNNDEKLWTVPLSWGSCIALRGVFGSDLTIGEKLAAWSWAEYENRVQPAEAVRTALEAPDLMVEEPRLYPFQRSGVRFLETAKQVLIADEMGTGKTIQILRALERQGANRTLVVCPNSTKFNWAKETERWTSITPFVVDGTAAKRRKQIAEAVEHDGPALVIINWESLRLHTRSEGYGNMALSDTEKEAKELNEVDWDAVVADEAHRAKNPKAKQTRALWAVSRDAEIRIAATGTPIANHPGDLWSIMNFVAPEDFPTKTKYVDRYCATSFNPFGGMDITGVKASTAEEFAHIVDSRMIRRVKDVVLTQLPSKVYSTRELTMSAKQAKAYREMADRMLSELDGEMVVATNPLSQMTRLSQFSCAHATVDEEGAVTLSDPSNKIDAMMDIVDEAEGQPIVVFAESRQLIRLAEDRLEKANVPYGIVAGDITPAQRQAHIDAFQSGKLPVMLVTVGAGGEGITLTAARVGVFLQRSWSMVKNKQAEDRIHRPGAEVHDSVEIIDLVTKGTIEEYRAVKLAEKEGRLQEVVRDETLREMLSYR